MANNQKSFTFSPISLSINEIVTVLFELIYPKSKCGQLLSHKKNSVNGRLGQTLFN